MCKFTGNVDSIKFFFENYTLFDFKTFYNVAKIKNTGY